MRAVIVSRYPRVDTPDWKRHVAEGLVAAGIDVALLYSRSSVVDQARAGLGEFGLAGVVRKLGALRGRGGQAEPAAAPAGPKQTLAAWAREHGVEVALCSRLGDGECLQRLRAMSPDLLVLAGADIVPAATLAVPRLGAINPHYGMLPAYRGMNVTEWSILHDDPVGVTVHYVDPGIDTGDIVLREQVEVVSGDTLATLRVKHQQAAARLLVDAARRIADGTVERTPQRPEDGRQHYRMHPVLRDVVERKLAEGSYRGMVPDASEPTATAG
jgi:methionyl-tRNA formyltransferase